jgi:hypothetical protein
MREVSVLFCFCFLAVRPSKLCMSRVHTCPSYPMYGEGVGMDGHESCNHTRTHAAGDMEVVLSAALDTCTQQSLYTTPVRASYNNFPCLHTLPISGYAEEGSCRSHGSNLPLSLCGEEAEKKADRPQSQPIPPTPSSPTTTAHTPGLPHTPPHTHPYQTLTPLAPNLELPLWVCG